ncbi:MAG: hypothetical protein JWR03_1276, partial [Cohnella sp.]|nr:hypothetical protein [Cohnella sp.]
PADAGKPAVETNLLEMEGDRA